MRRLLLDSRNRTRAILAAALCLPLIVPLSVAHADGDTGSQRVETYVQPVNADAFTLTELQRPGGLERLQTLQTPQALAAVLPHEVSGPAKSFAPRAEEDSAQPLSEDRLTSTAAATDAAAVSLPEPAHTMTLQECVAGLVGSEFYVKSRYAVCSGRQFGQVWIKNGTPVGESHFDVVVVGTIPKNSREMTATYYYTDFTIAGSTDARDLGVTTNASVSHSWPSYAQFTTGGNSLPATRKWAELLDGIPVKQTLTAPSGQPGGAGSLREISAIYQPNIKLVAPPGWASDAFTGGDIFMLPPRWDEASYLNASAAGGAAVFSVLATLKYSTADAAPEREVAKHIQKAFTKPTQTQPPLATKRLAGQNADEPLTRLYTDTERRGKNRTRAVWNCAKFFGPNYAADGKECDEFPFATTYQGAAGYEYDPLQDPLNFSVMALDGESNGAAGTLLGQFYTLNRIIDGPDDGFIVKITS